MAHTTSEIRRHGRRAVGATKVPGAARRDSRYGGLMGIKFLWRDVLGWGVLLWLVGYLLGFVFYALVPVALIGWFVMPFGVALTALVLWRWVRIDGLSRAAVLGLGWSAIAVLCDYAFIVELLAPPDGYYKLDVYLYYFLMLAMPVAAAALRRRRAIAAIERRT